MRLRENYRSTSGRPMRGRSTHTFAKNGLYNTNNVPDQEKEAAQARLDEQKTMGARLYTDQPLQGVPWGGFIDGYPSRVHLNQYSSFSHGISVLESGEIELRSSCGGSPTGCSTRAIVEGMTGHSITITTWNARPTLYTRDGTRLRKHDVRPLQRYCRPHSIDRNAENSCPTVMIDHDYSIAVPLLPGENGMFAYWPDEASMPTTWSSWLVTIENEKISKIMAAALRKVCKYANAANAMMRGAELTGEQRLAANREGNKIVSEWKNAAHMLGYLQKSHDPAEIAQMIMDNWSMRQVIALAAMASYYTGSAARTAAHGVNGKITFSKNSSLFRMLKEQTSEQYETKFLYTKPPEQRSNWQLVMPE